MRAISMNAPVSVPKIIVPRAPLPPIRQTCVTVGLSPHCTVHLDPQRDGYVRFRSSVQFFPTDIETGSSLYLTQSADIHLILKEADIVLNLTYNPEQTPDLDFGKMVIDEVKRVCFKYVSNHQFSIRIRKNFEDAEFPEFDFVQEKPIKGLYVMEKHPRIPRSFFM